MKITLKETLYIILVTILFQSCEDDSTITKPDIHYPIVKIISPLHNASVIDSTVIIVDAEDDKGIVQVEIFINNKTDSSKTFYVPPFEYIWQPPFDSDSSQYSIYAKAYDAEGNVGVSEVIFVFVRQFGPPSNLMRESISETAILLSWDDNSAIKTGFDIERKTNDSEFRLLARLDSNITNCLDDKLDNHNKYTYRVRAFNGNAFSEYSDNLSIYYKYHFYLENYTNGQSLYGTWGDLYTPVEISNDNLIYSYSFENTPYFNTRPFSAPSNWWSYILDNEEGLIYDIKFNYNDNKFLLGTNKGKIYSWTAYNSSIPVKKFLTDTDTTYSVSFCKNNNFIASSEANGVITIWAYNSGAKQKIIKTQIEGRTIVLLLPDGNTLVSGDANGVIKLWDINNGTLLKLVHAHNKSITQLIYNEAQNIIISSSMDGYIKLWNINGGAYITEKLLITSGVTDITMNHAGTKLIACGNGKFIYINYPPFNTLLSFSDYNFKNYSTASISPNGEKLLVGGNRYIGLYSDSSKWRIN